MSESPNPLLRLVHGDDADLATSSHDSASVAVGDSPTSRGDAVRRRSEPRRPESVDHVAGFWQAYTEATGWRIDPASGVTSDRGPAIRPHRPDAATEAGRSVDSDNLSDSLEQIESLMNVADGGEASEENCDWSDDDLQLLPAVLDGWLGGDPESAAPPLSASSARKLAAAARRMADQLQHQQDLLDRQQAELAARAAVISSEDGRRRCHTRIEQMLSDATLATGTSAAAVYLLDEDTEYLITRFLFGLSPVDRMGTRRPLRGARADLQAMIQGVLPIESLSSGPVDMWRAPESFPAGICVCLGGIDLPIGTLWLFAPQATDFDDVQTAAARIAADSISQTLQVSDLLHRESGQGEFTGSEAADPNHRLAARLSSDRSPTASIGGLSSAATEPTRSTETSCSEITDAEFSDAFLEVTETEHATDVARLAHLDSGSLTDVFAVATAKARQLDRFLGGIAQWQHATLPVGTRLAADWLVDGMIESPIEIAQSWHHWDVLPDGMLSLAICQSSMAGGGRLDVHDTLSLAMARAALGAHAGYRHTPADAVRRVLDTLWQIDEWTIDHEGRSAVDLLYAHIDPESGELSAAAIGRWTTLVASRYGYRPLGERRDRSPGRSWDELEFPGDQVPEVMEATLQPGEVLLVGGGAWLSDPLPTAATGMDWTSEDATLWSPCNQAVIGNALSEVMKQKGHGALAAVRRLLADTPVVMEHSAVTLQRLDA